MDPNKGRPPLDSLPEPDIPMGAPLGQTQFVPPKRPVAVEPAGPPAPPPEYAYKFHD